MKRLLLKRELRWFSWDQEVSQQLEKADGYHIPTLLPLLLLVMIFLCPSSGLFFFFFFLWTWRSQGILFVILCCGWQMRQESASFTKVIIVFDTLCLWHSCSTHDQRLMQTHDLTFHWFQFFLDVYRFFFKFCLFYCETWISNYVSK